MKRKKKIRNIILVPRLIHASWREFLKGFLDQARIHQNWNIRLLQSPEELTPTFINELEAENIDGIVICESIPSESKAKLLNTEIPMVVIGMKDDSFSKRKCGTVFIRNDDEDIGRFTARHFMSLGNFASWGFVPESIGLYWSDLRCKGFTDELRKNGKEVFVFSSPFSKHSTNYSLRLARWLKALPKPAAIMAAYDGLSRIILEACVVSGMKVPNQIAIVGVDNDPILCDFSTPSLTSVAPNHAKEGALAADALTNFLRNPKSITTKTILSNEKTIFERESTAYTSPSTTLVKRARSFIDRNCDKPIKTEVVLRHLGVSRSLADLRFRENRGETLAQAITKRRLEEVARRLRKTTLPIHTISTACGFSNVNHLKNLFKRHYGKCMRDWRSS